MSELDSGSEDKGRATASKSGDRATLPAAVEPSRGCTGFRANHHVDQEPARVRGSRLRPGYESCAGSSRLSARPT